MSAPHLNRLADQTSPYLRSAASQPVHWHPWGEEAFGEARSLNKPILLDIGAVWCHWCHVMDHESYENDTIAALINEKFVAIKVDRDERPDVDARYQAAVGAMTGQGGWPLTAFLLPDGRTFYGGTYFPPDDRHGRPGLSRVLTLLADAYIGERDKLLGNAEAVIDAIQRSLERSGTASLPGIEKLDLALSVLARAHDARYGGFGGAPKFPHAATLDLLMACYRRKAEPWILEVVVRTLNGMSRGGMYDHLGGGFHRYSTDERWIVPHFEKMLYDQAPLISTYVNAFRLTKDEEYRRIARETIEYCMNTLYHADLGGFGGSQDADIAPEDDGSYYTWSVNDLEGLPELLRSVARSRYHVEGQGEMPHDRTQHVLFLNSEPEEISKALNFGMEETVRLVDETKIAMAKLRRGRTPPFIDATVYAGWNGMMISALSHASTIVDDPSLAGAATTTAARLLREYRGPNGLITHTPVASGGISFLDDQVFVAEGLLDLHAVTGVPQWLRASEEIVRATITNFADPFGGFYDSLAGSDRAGTVEIRMKPFQDAPTPGANAVAIKLCLRFHQITGDSIFRSAAESALRLFADVSAEHALYHSTYLHAVLESIVPPSHIVVFGEGSSAQALRTMAASVSPPGTIITSYTSAVDSDIPEYLRSFRASNSDACALVCSAFTCSSPVHTPDALREAIQTYHPTTISR